MGAPLCRSAGLRIAGASPVAEHRLWGTRGPAVAAPGLQGSGAVAVVHSSRRGLSCSAAPGIFPNQGSNACPVRGQLDSVPSSRHGSPLSMFFMEVIHSHC